MTTQSDFHEERKTGLGGSDAASVLRVSKYGTPLGVWMSKMGLTEPGETSEAAEWGKILEPVVLEQYAKRENYHVLGRMKHGEDECIVVFNPDGEIYTDHPIIDEHGHLMGLLRHPKHEFMIAHLDGVAFKYDESEGWIMVRGLDAKTTSAYLHDEWGEGDKMPDDYAVQVHHYQIVLGGVTDKILPFDVPVLIGGQRWQCPALEFNPDLAEKMIKIEGEFWHNHVKANIAPESQPTDNLSRLYPEEEEGKEILAEPNSQLEMHALFLSGSKDKLKDAETIVCDAENKIKEQMETAARIQGNGWSITWKKSKDREKVDWEALAQELYDIYRGQVPEHNQTPLGTFKEKHTTTSPGPRVFRTNLKGLKHE